MAIEKPKFDLILKDRNIEVRAYHPYITAELVMVGKDFEEAANSGFSPLARYIFGANISNKRINMTAPVTAQPVSEKIDMTAPVTVSKAETLAEGTFKVAFMMPAKYTLADLPKPVDSRITFRENPARNMAVIRYSGFFNQSNYEKHLRELETWLQKHDYEKAGQPVVAGYDPPFTPWFLKHNEIMIAVQG